ncbi:MAG: hypothetical protein JNK82_01625 [Myxococcaceae bacterium]|nr:hypothetical protein [Myxococcaceae bacterium]
MRSLPWWAHVIFLVWSLAWLAGAWGFFSSATSSDHDAAEREQPLTGLVDSGPIRVEATVNDQPTFVAPVTGKTCAVLTSGVGAYGTKTETDSQGKSHTVYSYASVRKRREPQVFRLDVKGAAIEVSTEHWAPSPGQTQSKYLHAPPPGWDVTEEELQAAKAKLGSTYAGWYLDEGCLPPGQPVLVRGIAQQGRVMPPAGEAHVDLFPGTQADAVAHARTTAKGLRFAGVVFIGVSTLPWGVLLIIVLRRRRQPT